MTVAQVIEMVRILLDESSNEFLGDDVDFDIDIKDAIREAAYQKMREWWYRGDKEALRPFWRQVVNAAPGPYTFPTEADVPMYIDSVRLLIGGAYTYPARFVPYETFSNFLAPLNAASPVVTGQFVYTLYNDQILYQGGGATISYYARPDYDDTSIGQIFDNIYTGNANAEWIHAQIAERAAEILQQRSPNDQDRQGLGTFFDMVSMLEKQSGGGQP